MDNSYFIYTEKGQSLDIERFHICTWEFRNNTALIEFGFEINAAALNDKPLISLTLFVPWFNDQCQYEDFYSRLKESVNSRFIFNDSIIGTTSLDGGSNLNGVIHEFSGRNKMCILPITFQNTHSNHQIGITINLDAYHQCKVIEGENRPNVYIRFCVKPNVSFISTRKKGISKSTIIYDIKLNERRNIPEQFLNEIGSKQFCTISSCFCFNIVPNSYDLVFFDAASLQNVRTLEYESFNRYLNDERVKKDELIVVFNKKKRDNPFSFFAIYSKERIGAGLFALAIFLNIVCGTLLFIPSYRTSQNPKIGFSNVWYQLPAEVYVAIFIALLTMGYFIWPLLQSIFKRK